MTAPLDLSVLRASLSDPVWRIDNIYRIQDKDGNDVKFVRNEAQRKYWQERWYRNCVLKARQLGLSTFIELLMLDSCLFYSNTSAGIVDFGLDDAVKKLDKIKFAYNRLPEFLKEQRPLVKDNTKEIVFGNDSNIRVGTSHVGSTLQSLHVSEYGKIAAEFPDKAKEIKKGAFGTVAAGQMIHVEATARGNGGEFFDMVERSQDMAKEGRQLSQLDFKFHFFAWWQDPKYRLNPVTVVVSAELNEYFADVQAKTGVSLDAHQRAWYSAMLAQVGPDDMKTEYPSTPEEAFLVSLEGAYFKRELAKARAEKRIGERIPYDSSRLVNTFWDLGVNHVTAIWFHQTDGVRHRMIDYYDNSGEGIDHYAAVLKDKHEKLGYNYGKHVGPHDIEVREWGSPGAKPRIKIAEELGIKFIVCPRVRQKADAIEPTRRFINMCWFDVERTQQGVKCLDNYTKQWNDRLSTWRDEPLDNWAADAADSLMTGVLGLTPDAVPNEGSWRSPPPPKTSSWAA